MKRYIFWVLIAALNLSVANGQSSGADFMLSAQTNEIIPPAPSTAQQVRYQSPQPSLATGAVNLSIPLYTIEAEGISIPFTMHYQTSGIKPADDPLPFGYGWSLQPALKVVRTIRGRADEDYEYRGDRPGDLQLNPSDAFAAMCRVSPGGLSAENTQNRYDAEKDIFTVTLPSGVYSRIIVKDPANSSQWLFIGGGDDDDVIITGTRSLSSITVTDAQGIIYRFGDVQEIAYIPPGPDAPETTSWELSDITLPSGRKITFGWEKFNHAKISFVGGDVGRDSYDSAEAYHQFYQDWLSNYPQTGFSNDGYYMERAHLANVSFPGGSISLEYIDQKLSTFTVKNSLGSELRKAVFTYGASGAEAKFLTSVELNGEGKYSFTYNSRRFDDPSEQNKQDWWGYYNGRGGYPYQMTSLTPALKIKTPYQDYYPSEYESIGYSDRRPDAEAMQAGILTKITYPTGGSSEFTYEPHRFSPQKVNSYGNLSEDSDPNLEWGGGLRVKTIVTRKNADDPDPQTKTYLYGPAVVTAVPSAATFVAISYGIGLYEERTVSPRLYHFRNVSVAAQSDYMNNHIGEDAIWYDKVVERYAEGMTEYNFGRTIASDIETREWGFVCPVAMRNIFSKGARLTAKHVFKKVGAADSSKVYSEEYSYSKVKQNKYVTNSTIVGAHISRYLLQSAVNTIESPDFTNGEVLSYVTYILNTLTSEYVPYPIKIRIKDTYPLWLYSENGPYRVEPYTIEFCSDRLASKTVTRHLENGDYSRTETYEYIDGTSIIKSVTTTTSNDSRTDRIDIEYASKSGGSVQSAMVTANMVGVPIMTTRRFGSATTVVSRDMASYGNRVYRPARVLQSFGGPSWVAGWYDYDNFGNLREYRGQDSVPTTYLWGYSGTHPVYRIDGASYAQIKGLGLAATAYNGSAEQVDATSRLDQWLATHLIWSPLVGVTSQRAPDGLTSTYTYDSAGRLTQAAISGHGNVAAYSYHINDGGLNFTETKAYTSSTASSVREIVNYDGLGRQTTHLTAAADAISLTPNYYATLTQYDAMDRPYREWSTVKVSETHPTEAQISAAASDLYGDSYACKTTFYEPSPMAVTTATRKAGKEWAMADRRVSVRHLVNKASGDYACPKYKDLSDAKIAQDGYYAAGSLTIEEITDEEGHVTMTFTDCRGLTVMTREGTPSSSAQPKWLDTRYVYNDLGQLLYVIQPKQTGSQINRSDLFRYVYDSRGNCMSKTFPSGEATIYRYDRANRLIAEQDGNMRDKGQWLFHFYDSFGREALSFLASYTDQKVGALCSLRPVAVAPTASSVINNATGGYTLSDAPSDLISSELVEARYYDSYEFAGSLPSGWKTYTSLSGFATPAASVRGLSTGVFAGNRLTVTHYDALNHVVRTAYGEPTAAPQLVNHTRYDYEGKAVEERIVTAGSLTASDQKIERTYYKSGHLRNVATTQGAQTAQTTYTYGGDGRISLTKFDNAISRSDSYNANGWLTSSRMIYLGTPSPELELKPIGPINPINPLGSIGTIDPVETLIFEESLHYATVPSGCTARYDGKIAGRIRGGNLTAYAYDTHGRLLSATPKAYGGQVASAVPDLGTEYSYDANANITSLMRRGIVDIVGGTKVYGVHTDMTMSYSGNRLSSMTVSRSGADYEGRTGVAATGSLTGFTYDKNGNLTADPSRGISRIEYNRLNLPVTVTFTNGQRQTVTYDGAGNKLRTDYYQLPATMLAGADVAEYADSDYELTGSRVYIGPHVFTDGKLEYSAFPGGYFDPKWGKARYYVTDWQGNHAAVVSGAGNIVQQTEYYPYGEPTIEPEGQRYLFGGKEREHGGGRNSYDFGARSLTPYGNWSTVDPLAEKFYQLSPYSYCGGDPVNYVDRDGKVLDTVWDIWNILYDVGAAIKDHIYGEHEQAKDHWEDALWDTGAAVVPFVPAGGSKAVRALKQVGKTESKTVKSAVKSATQYTTENLKYLRQKAVKQAWKEEQNMVKRTGKGTRKWTPAEKEELLKTGKVKGYEGHHINNVKDHPELAGNPDNITFVNRTEHLEKHHGNFKNETHGELLNRGSPD